MNLHEELMNGWCVVEFTKKNGDSSKVLCTTKPEYIPESLKPKGTGRDAPDGQVRVYAADRAGWRTIIENQITSVSKW
jgi:hypothetical protein